MTKIGEGNIPPEVPNIDSYKQQLDTSSAKFLKALEEYNQSKSSDEQKYLKDVMDQQMAIIKSSIAELNKKGIQKDAMKVTKDYKDYIEEDTPSNYTSLHNDIETLRDLNKR